MDLTLSEYLMLVIKRKKIKLGDICETLGCTRQNLNKKFNRNSWTDESLKQIADAIGCNVRIVLTDKDTGEEY